MFQFIDIDAADLNKIYAIRNQSQNSPLNRMSLTGGAARSLTFPHETYTVGLSALKAPTVPEPTKIGIRVIEAANDNFNRIYDVNNIAGGTEPQMFQDESFIKSYEKAFSQLLESGLEKDNYVVRTLKVPVLHVDALWLHNPTDAGADKYLPVHSMDLLSTNRFYTQQEFFEVLKTAAEKYDMTDDLLGG